ncbi:MAG: hypothetical protein L0387_12920, partial [Acidobacteria bacterium]|nr:hypothetical protein [Acidobacteriota bacterium]
MGRGNPIPNNIIPERCLDPVAQKILSLVPQPNIGPTSGPLNVNNFLRVPSIIDDTDSYTARSDYQLGTADNLFVRYTYSDRFRFVPGTFGGIIDGTGTS